MKSHLLLVISSLAHGNCPAQDPLATLQEQLKRHPFFKAVSFQIDSSHPTYTFLLQQSLNREEKNYERLIINPILPYLTKVEEIFVKTYCEPNGLQRRADASRTIIAVLASRGLYDDYARVTSEPSLHASLAHYNPTLGLAVTYRSGFGSGDAHSERHSLLHEFVHALQHAYSSTGRMPAPMWFNEGLAEYRSAHTNMVRSLDEPPHHDGHLEMAQEMLGGDLGRRHLIQLGELVALETYEAAVAAIRRQVGQQVDRGIALACFYTQSQMLVRYLHEGEQGHHRAGFVRYFGAVQTGKRGLEAFRECFGLTAEADLKAMEAGFVGWLQKTLLQSSGAGTVAGTDGETAPLKPPVAFDAKVLAWSSEDWPDRVAAARALAAEGRYAAALAILPTDAEAAPLPAESRSMLGRERYRMQVLIDLRSKLVQALPAKAGDIELAGQRGRLQQIDQDHVVLLVKSGEQRLLVTPKMLLQLGQKAKSFEYAESWKEVWLRWLGGEELAKLRQWKGKDYSRRQELERDLTGDLDITAGAAAQLLQSLQTQELPNEHASAQELLHRLLASTRSGAPLWQRRREPTQQLLRALAERAFSTSDPAALGIRGTLTKLDNERVRVHYPSPAQSPNLDFTGIEQAPVKFARGGRIAYDGPTQVRPESDHWALIGNGALQWPMPWRGAMTIELEYQFAEQSSDFVLMLCVAPGRYLLVDINGRVKIDDSTTNLRDEKGVAETVFIAQPQRMKIEHDGAKQMTVEVNGKRTATVASVGNCTHGHILLVVRSSAPIHLRNFSISGTLDPRRPGELRERSVQRLLASMWQPLPAGSASDDAAPAPGTPTPARLRDGKLKGLVAQPQARLALAWLARHQDDDGRWDVDGFRRHDPADTPGDGAGNPVHDIGVTALAMMAFCFDGSSLTKGPYSVNLQAATQWLMSQQNMATGAISPMNHGRAIIDHALATAALAELLQRDGNDQLRGAVTRAVSFLEQYRNPYLVWDYVARTNDSRSFTTACCVDALVRAKHAGIAVTEQSLQNATTWFESVAEPKGRHGYQKAGEYSARMPGDHGVRFPTSLVETCTAIAMHCRLMLGQTPASKPVLRAAAELLLAKPPSWDRQKGSIDECYWYFGTSAMWHFGGKQWQDWRRQLVPAVTKNQQSEGPNAGSWDPVGAWSEEGGRVGITALLALALLMAQDSAGVVR